MKITEIPPYHGTKFTCCGTETIYILDASQMICTLMKGKTGKPIELTLTFLQRDDFELVPDEPKVLNIDEWVEEKRTEAPQAEWSTRDIKTACIVFNENGRLERDLEYKPVIDAIYSRHSEGLFDNEKLIKQALAAIPPLTKDLQ